MPHTHILLFISGVRRGSLLFLLRSASLHIFLLCFFFSLLGTFFLTYCLGVCVWALRPPPSCAYFTVLHIRSLHLNICKRQNTMRVLVIAFAKLSGGIYIYIFDSTTRRAQRAQQKTTAEYYIISSKRCPCALAWVHTHHMWDCTSVQLGSMCVVHVVGRKIALVRPERVLSSEIQEKNLYGRHLSPILSLFSSR